MTEPKSDSPFREHVRYIAEKTTTDLHIFRLKTWILYREGVI